ncbi:MAG: peptide chain release factor N(5)-glutamine methyltransferase, partial [Thiobacillus sp.]|nr:peptide chain release factor N(5)-glutamine methyltransferase [Thiobacillus sp.]
MYAESGNVAQLLGGATARIAASLGLDPRDARLDARVLAAFVWDVSPAWLIAHDRDTPDAEAVARYRQLVERRAAGVPVAYLVGEREFHGRAFHVTPDVLIPRPDTELLVERALAALPPETSASVLDLGTGSGCIAVTLALERPRARVVAVDRSPAALAIAARNAAAL